jgi:hypothetical protein
MTNNDLFSTAMRAVTLMNPNVKSTPRIGSAETQYCFMSHGLLVGWQCSRGDSKTVMRTAEIGNELR